MSTVMGEWFAVAGRQSLPLPGADLVRWPLVSVLELGAFASAPACARLHAKTVLADWGLPRGVAADAEMICSELMTNALRATLALDPPQPIGLRLLSVPDRRLVIEAWDSHPGRPVRRSVGEGAEDGRGLVIVEELSSRWGMRLSAHVKTVWAEMPLGDEATA
jgi:anti-sigma regulatory factor (Ser/Thr protein kinase)